MEWRACSTCGQGHLRAGQRLCLKCHAAYMREWRKTHPPSEVERAKGRCRSYTHVLIKRGKISRQPCRECGARAEGHHPDYEDPRRVVWLCRKHHLELHRSIP